MIIIKPSIKLDQIPLGSDFWTAYFDVDSGISLSGSDIVSWESLVGSYTAISGIHAPSISTIGSQKAIRFDVANTEAMKCNALASVLAGDDTAFTVALHVVPVTLVNLQTFFTGGSSLTTTIYYWFRNFSTTAAIITARDGGSIVNGSAYPSITAGTEYTFVIIRHGDTYDIMMNGVRVVTGGALATGSLTLDTFGIGALITSSNEYYHGDMLLRRIAITSGSSISNTQLTALNIAWRGK